MYRCKALTVELHATEGDPLYFFQIDNTEDSFNKKLLILMSSTSSSSKREGNGRVALFHN
jgi:hypothetical protein